VTSAGSHFLVGLVEAALGAAVLVRNPRQPVNRWFAAFAASLAAWSVLVGLARVVESPALDLVRSRAVFAAASLVPLTFFRFAALFPNPGGSQPWLAQTVSVIGLFVSGLAFSPWIVAATVVQAGPNRPVYGPLHPLFGAYFILCVLWSLGGLVRKLRYATGFARAQLQYLFVGGVAAFVGGATTNLVMPLVFGTSRFSLYGPYFTLILVGFIAHSMVRHRLMDIRVVISRSVAYAGGWLLTAGLVVGSGVVLGAYALDQPQLSPVYALLLGLAAALGFVVLAPRLKSLADRYLYRPAYDARQLVRDGGRAVGTVADPARVVRAMAELINQTLHLESLAVVVWNRDRDAYQPAYRHHVHPTFAWPGEALSARSPLVHLLTVSGAALLPGDLARRTRRPEDAQAVASELRAWNAEVAVPVRDGQLIAVILAGPKLSGDSYFGEDVDLLETLASELAIGLKNAQLYHEVVSIKEYNERILAHMDSGVVAVREDGVVTTLNPAAERIIGVPARRAILQSMTALDPAVQAVLRDSLAGRRDAETEITVSQPGGRILPLIVHTSALHDHQGQVRGAIAVLNDHSRLKALEEDKRRADRLTALGAMASGIAHEIRNPLVAIKTFAELLPERADDQEFRSTFAKVAVKEIHRIEQLLGRLRALAAPQTFPLRPLDLQVPLVETLDLLRGEADRRRVRFVVEIEPRLPPVMAEADQVKQLFLNLLMNGLEAMAGGGTLSVSVRADRERADRERPERGLVTVRVADTGPGIPREDLARIFEPFFTTKVHGTGLGLAISRSIADAHRAALWAEPGPAGVGTAFVIQFPAAAAAPVPQVVR
jgi:PAS domain S-box-containing protein